jgi:hypothetical protein
VIAEKIEEAVGLAAARAEMNVGDEERTEPNCAVLKRHEESSRGCYSPRADSRAPLQDDDTRL